MPGGSSGGAFGEGGGEDVFLGQHSPRLDDKGRVILPAKFREGLAAGVVITKGQERCLYVWPAAQFAHITADLADVPLTNKAARAYSRVLFAGASDEIPDKQGRITLPPALREYADLTKECVVIGNNTRVEIWDVTNWESYLVEQEQAFSEVSEEVLPQSL